MKPRDRSINIFSLSMLDVISGALGAFLIIMIVLFPYYNKESIDYQQQIQEIQRQVEAAEAQAEAAQAQAQEAEERAQEAESRLENIRFLIVSIKWTTEKQDVDLHIIDAAGEEFSYARRIIAGRPGELTEDDRNGPGKEVWEVLTAPPGQYKVYANLFSRKGNSQNPQIEARVFYRDGRRDIPVVRLTREGEKKLLATLTVGENGEVSFLFP